MEELFNYQSTGAKGLRISAQVCAVLAVASAIGGAILGWTDKELGFWYPFLTYLAYGAILCVVAFVLRALASITEAAEMYYYKNCQQQSEESEQ